MQNPGKGWEQSTSHCQTKHGKHLASSQAIPTSSIWSLTVCKYGGGRPWEIWSRVDTSGRQRVDTHGVVPNKESCSPFMYYQFQGLEARALARQHQYHSLFNTRYGNRHETGIIAVRHCPLCVCPLSSDVSARDQISQALPPPCLHTVSNQRLKVGTAWDEAKCMPCLVWRWEVDCSHNTEWHAQWKPKTTQLYPGTLLPPPQGKLPPLFAWWEISCLREVWDM